MDSRGGQNRFEENKVGSQFFFAKLKAAKPLSVYSGLFIVGMGLVVYDVGVHFFDFSEFVFDACLHVSVAALFVFVAVAVVIVVRFFAVIF